MLVRHVLAGLAAGIAANDDDVARASIAKIDPVARGRVKRKLERALVDAALACDAAQLARPPIAHVMRLAALALAKRPAEHAGDQAAVAAAYAALPSPQAPPRAPIFTIAVLVLAAVLAGGVAFFILSRPGPPSRTYVRALSPPSAEAFRAGGVPLRDAAIDALLEDKLTNLVVQAGRIRDYDAPDVEALVKPLRDPPAIVKHGAPVSNAWGAMLDTFGRSIIASKQDGGPTQRQRDDIVESVRELSAAFANAGLGYFLEGRFKSGYAFVQAYRVEEVVFVVAGGSRRRVLSLRRLDRLNTAYALLGMHDEDVGDPVLMLDRIDATVASTVLPVLANDASYKLADREWLLTEPGKSLAAAVGATVRAEIAAALGKDAEPVAKIAKLLVERADLIEQWRDALDRKHIRFVRTEDLFLPKGLLDELDGVVSTYQRKRVIAIEDELAELEAPRIHARVHDLVAATVRRHEAQHGFDYDRDAELRYPATLEEMLGPPHDADGDAVPIVRAARAELSAYLSQIANDPVTPQGSLWNLGRQVFNRDRFGTGEFYAGIVVIEGLASKLGATVEGPRFRRGVDRDRLAGYATSIVKQPPAALRAAAAALWTELYGEPPTTIVDASPSGSLASRDVRE